VGALFGEPNPIADDGAGAPLEDDPNPKSVEGVDDDGVVNALVGDDPNPKFVGAGA
jgi:hypothetical protein